MNYLQQRIQDYLDAIADERHDWNDIVINLLDNDMRFWSVEKPTLDRQLYFLTNQLIDILNLERRKLYHKIQYELADIFSMAFGYMVTYGDPYDICKHRFALINGEKGEENIVDKYEKRFEKYGETTLYYLRKILDIHDKEEYFMTKEACNGT